MAVSTLRIGADLKGNCEFGSEIKDAQTAIGPLSKALAWRNELKAKPIVLKSHSNSFIQVENSAFIPEPSKWFENSNNNSINNPNFNPINNNYKMREIQSAEDLVTSLLNAGDKLVIVHFYSPSCGGCKPLLPKMDQFAEANENAIFLKVNQEVHKLMCYTLKVRVLPFFHFYRGAQGRICSFSCTLNTIKKFKDALEKHGGARFGVGPAKGLEESEILNLASNKLFNYPKFKGYNNEDWKWSCPF